jgi:hypothetical protein
MRARDAALSFVIACACGDGAAVRGDDTGGDTSDDGDDVGTAVDDDEDEGDTTHVDPDDGTSTDGDATSSGESSTTGGGGVPGAWCEPIPTCDAPLPDPGPAIDWEHTETTLVVASGAPMHRGRDMFFLEDDQHWVLGKFAYGLNDYDLEDEQVDLYLLRNCTGDWEPLGGVRTTWEGDHAEVEGIVDTGGRVYVPLLKKLEPGRHRVHMVVRGDLTRADQYIEVVPPGTPVVLSDVDGTLTTSETEEFFDLLSGSLPEVQPGAPEALQALAAAGYHPIYLTSRPEFLGTRTQQFIRDRGLPPGIVHTSLNYTGALGDAAIEQKTAELAAFAERGLVPAWVFGNTSSDADAYDNAGIQPVEQRVFLAYDDAHGGRRIESWQDIVAEVQGVPDLCE